MKKFLSVFFLSFLLSCGDKRNFTGAGAGAGAFKLNVSGEVKGLSSGKATLKLTMTDDKDGSTKPQDLSLEIDGATLEDGKFSFLDQEINFNEFTHKLVITSSVGFSCTAIDGTLSLDAEKKTALIENIKLTCDDHSGEQIACSDGQYRDSTTKGCKALSTLTDSSSCLAAKDNFIWSGDQCQVERTCKEEHFLLNDQDRECKKFDNVAFKDRVKCLSATTNGNIDAGLYWAGSSCKIKNECDTGFYLKSSEEDSITKPVCTELPKIKTDCLKAREVRETGSTPHTTPLYWLGGETCTTTADFSRCNSNYFILPDQNECKNKVNFTESNCTQATTNKSQSANLVWDGISCKEPDSSCLDTYYRNMGERKCKLVDGINQTNACLKATKDGSSQTFYWLGGDKKCSETFSSCDSNHYKVSAPLSTAFFRYNVSSFGQGTQASDKTWKDVRNMQTIEKNAQLSNQSGIYLRSGANGVKEIKGSTYTKVTFPTNLPSAYTICSVTRYEETYRRWFSHNVWNQWPNHKIYKHNQHRILTSNTVNWLHGHWNSQVGVAHYENWYTSESGVQSSSTKNDWLIFCGQNKGYDNQEKTRKFKYWNISKETIEPRQEGSHTLAKPNSTFKIGINIRPAEFSSWAAREIVVWDSALSEADINVVIEEFANNISNPNQNIDHSRTCYTIDEFTKYQCLNAETASPFYWSGTTCSTSQGCEAGFYLDPTNDKICLACPEGSKCPGASVEKSSCPSGTYSAGGASSCTDCQASFYCPGGTDKKSCPAGKECPSSSMSAGTDCPSGTYSAGGASSCTGCEASFYCPGGTDKKSCPAGKECLSSSMTAGTDCPSGTYSAGGASSCKTCEAGYYCPGNSNRKSCPAGKECPSSSMIAGTNCGAGTYSAGGASSCTRCQAGFSCPGGSNRQSCPSPSTSNPGASSCFCSNGVGDPYKACKECTSHSDCKKKYKSGCRGGSHATLYNFRFYCNSNNVCEAANTTAKCDAVRKWWIQIHKKCNTCLGEF